MITRKMNFNLNKFKKTAFSSSQGFTLVELLVYTFSLVIISAVVVSFTIRFLGVNESSRRSREALDNARRSLETIAGEIHNAKGIYTPTSTFATSPGQLSVETTRDTPSDETTTFADFYVDNESLYLKREGASAQLITSEKVKVTNLTFTYLNGSTINPSVQTKITVVYKDRVQTGSASNAVSLETTTSLRSY